MGQVVRGGGHRWATQGWGARGRWLPPALLCPLMGADKGIMTRAGSEGSPGGEHSLGVSRNNI